MKFRFLPPAGAEFDEATMFYEGRESGLGTDFARAVERTIQEFVTAEFAFLEDRFRFCPVSKFPYIVIYGIDHMVEIVAVMHTSRRPGYWRNRVSSSENPCQPFLLSHPTTIDEIPSTAELDVRVETMADMLERLEGVRPIACCADPLRGRRQKPICSACLPTPKKSVN